MEDGLTSEYETILYMSVCSCLVDAGCKYNQDIVNFTQSLKMSMCGTSYSSFFLIGVHSMQGWTATTRHGVTRKEAQKRL